MNRRQFIPATIGAFITPAILDAATIDPSDKPAETKYKRVFRLDGDDYREIDWHDMKIGDSIIFLDIWDDGKLIVYGCKLGKDMKHFKHPSGVDAITDMESVRDITGELK